jgi:hypothetical protein
MSAYAGISGARLAPKRFLISALRFGNQTQPGICDEAGLEPGFAITALTSAAQTCYKIYRAAKQYCALFISHPSEVRYFVGTDWDSRAV